MTYEEVLASFNHQMLAGDDRMGMLRRVNQAFESPDDHYHVIHIAGTNGKGSTGTVLATSLQLAGSRVGYFSSPALVDEREMIKINGEMISKADFVKTYQGLVSQLPADISPTDLTVFEWWTLIALKYFQSQRVDWAVIECGMGGTNDATNVIGAPEVAIITHLGLDHTDVLGKGIGSITRSAAGILKAGSQVCILAPHQAKAAERIIHQVCQQVGVPLIQAGNQVKVTEGTKKWDPAKGMPMAVDGECFDHLTTTTSLLGSYQIDNLTTIATAISWLSRHGLKNLVTAFTKATSTTHIPGRMQMIKDRPLTFLDAAHNPDGAAALLDSCQRLFKQHGLVFVLGFLADKDWQQMARMYQNKAKLVVATTPRNFQRALPALELASYLPGALAVKQPAAALKQAQAMAQPQDVVVATGSFYLVKELLPSVTSGQITSHLDQRSSY